MSRKKRASLLDDEGGGGAEADAGAEEPVLRVNEEYARRFEVRGRRFWC